MTESAKKPFVILIYVALILSTLLVFWQVGKFGFVNYDDNDYVSRNLHVTNGLSREGIIWAFTVGYAANWHPLTWLSHMLDCRLFGTDPGWMHLTNLFLHLANTLLLLTVLRKMTGALWPSVFVAAAFALHPMHVESVAWIAERKDVLSMFFMLLTLAAYLSYVKRRGMGRYVLTMLLFAFGLMAKPMLVTLPFLLLLLDYWPLNRFDAQSRQRVMIEKIPFFVLAAASSAITFLVQRGGGTVVDINALPLTGRLANALLSYVKYLWKMFWPHDLAVHYPLGDGSFVLWQVMICALLLLGISILVIRFGRERKYLPVGWFWFLASLVPVIGIVQVGGQALADRYTYIPYTGLFIMIAWGLPRLLSKWPQQKIALGIAAAVTLAALGIATCQQVGYWKNSLTLFSHAIEVTRNNDVAHNNRGVAYNDLGRWQEAIKDLREAIRIAPNFAEAHGNLGIAFGGLGRSAEAIGAYRQAISLKPAGIEAHYNLANELAAHGDCNEAADQYREALKLRPDWPACMNNLAYLIATNPQVKDRDAGEAIRLASRASECANHKDPVFLDTLAAAYASAGRFGEAVDMANKALVLADAANQPQLKDIIQKHLSLYKQGKPCIELAPSLDPTPANRE